MPRFAANLTMLFTEVSFLERFRKAKEHGFDYVEFLFPYEWPSDVLRKHLDEFSLQQVLFNLPPGNWAKGERGIACHPDRSEEFKKGVDLAIRYAHDLGVHQINCLAGLKPENVSSEEANQTLLENLNFAADQLAKEDIRLLIEPINSRIDMPGFFLDTMDKAFSLLSKLGNDNLRLQFDFYHMQIMHGDVIRLFQTHQEQIAHIQFADNPGRHEPETGELNYDNIFAAIDNSPYSGWVSAEYRPAKSTPDSLSWFTRNSRHTK